MGSSTAAHASARRRGALELAVVGVATVLYLALVPERPVWVDGGLALLAAGLVAASVAHTRRTFWDDGTEADPRHAAREMAALLLATAVVAAGFAAWRVWQTSALEPVLRPSALATLVAFVPWAWLQQALLQFYLLGRLRALLPRPRPVLALVSGVLFGAVHLPDIPLALITVPGGAVWSYYYLRWRRLGPLALSHAVLGTAYFHWVRGEELITRWLDAL